MLKYLTPIFLILFAIPVWAYDIGIGGVTVVQRGNIVIGTVTVELGTSGVTAYRKDVTARINILNPTWKVIIRNELRDKVLQVNTDQIAEDNFQAGVSTFKAWLKGQVE